MATDDSFANFVVEQLSGAGDVYVRKMFGEYALYCDAKVVGLITDNTLFIKITDEGKKFNSKDYQEGYAYKGAKASMRIDEDLISRRDWITELVSITARSLPLPKAKKKAKLDI